MQSGYLIVLEHIKNFTIYASKIINAKHKYPTLKLSTIPPGRLAKIVITKYKTCIKTSGIKSIKDKNPKKDESSVQTNNTGYTKPNNGITKMLAITYHKLAEPNTLRTIGIVTRLIQKDDKSGAEIHAGICQELVTRTPLRTRVIIAKIHKKDN